MWEILGETTVNKRKHFIVACPHCSYIGTRRKDHVLSGRTAMCKSCASKLTAETYGVPYTYKGVGDLGATFFRHIKQGAQKRGLHFNVSHAFLWDLFLAQDKRCAYSGVELIMVRNVVGSNVDWANTTASLDRKDSSIGYEETNVQWVHKVINRFKNVYSEEVFLSMCNLVAQNHSVGTEAALQVLHLH